jgi:hypothetical protein
MPIRLPTTSTSVEVLCLTVDVSLTVKKAALPLGIGVCFPRENT